VLATLSQYKGVWRALCMCEPCEVHTQKKLLILKKLSSISAGVDNRTKKQSIV
jgi:hypothetical protein